MRIRPIPKRLLPHAAMLHKEIVEDRWGKSHLDDGVSLKYIKLEPSTQIIRDKNNAEIQLAATLFFDCVNSQPVGQSFAVDDVIIFNGEQFCVKTIETLYVDVQPHHYEMGLIRSG